MLYRLAVIDISKDCESMIANDGFVYRLDFYSCANNTQKIGLNTCYAINDAERLNGKADRRIYLDLGYIDYYNLLRCYIIVDNLNHWNHAITRRDKGWAIYFKLEWAMVVIDNVFILN